MPFDIPVLSEVVQRPRLDALLTRHRHCRIVMVTGQAAQGKSTLLASHLARDKVPSLWFHLTPSVSDSGALFDLFARGLLQLGVDLAQTPSFPHVSLGTRQELPRQAEMIRAALARVAPLNLVLDDMEALSPGAKVLELIQTLLADAPSGIRFFLLSRTRPDLNLSRFKMKKELLELSNPDLAFTLEETLAFFNESGQSGLDPMTRETAEKLMARTSGWAGGLVLFLEAARHTLDLERVLAHLSFEALSWFSQEIFEGLSPELRRFLRQTALFEELDTRILSLVFPDTDAVALLNTLEQRNLFIQKLVARNPWPVYKYNNLFREFLLDDLNRAMDEAELAALNRAIGQVYWDETVHEKAVPFFMAAQDHDMVAHILRIKGADYVITGRTDRLVRWIDALPEERVKDDPWLLFFRTMAGRIRGGKKNISGFGRALALFRAQDDIRGILLSLAYLIEASVFIRQPSQIILSHIRDGEAALAGLGGQYRFTWARTLLWQQIGLGYIAGTGDIPKGISACQNAILLARGIKNPGLLLNASVILTLGLVQSGDFAAARDMLARTREISLEDRQPEYRALEDITNIDLALKRGDTDQAGTLLARSGADIETFGLIFLYPGLVEARALYHIGTGQFAQAIQAADHLSDFSILDGNDFYQGVARRIRATALLLKGDARAARDHAQKAVADLDRSRRGDIHLYLARQVLGLALFLLGDMAGACAELAPARAYFRQIRSDLSFCETAFVLGLACLELKDPAGAAILEQGLGKALENRYGFFPLLSPALMGQVLVRACETLADPEAVLFPYVRNCTRPEILAAIQEKLTQMPESRHPGNGECLAALFRLSCPKLTLRTLGPFAVIRGNTPIPASAFGGAKPLMLLKVLLLKGATEVPKEMLMDALWPEADEAGGEKNLKVNLHRVRKGLEPESPKSAGQVYLSQRGGRVSLEPDLVSWDVQTFDQLAARGRSHEAAKELESALGCFQKALVLYQGDFLADDPYLEGVVEMREMLRQNCLDLFMRKAAIHRELLQWPEAEQTLKQALALDACHEKACQDLMQLFGRTGRKTEAAKVFSRLKEQLEKELDAEPDSRTIAVYDQVVRGGAM